MEVLTDQVVRAWLSNGYGFGDGSGSGLGNGYGNGSGYDGISKIDGEPTVIYDCASEEEFQTLLSQER